MALGAAIFVGVDLGVLLGVVPHLGGAALAADYREAIVASHRPLSLNPLLDRNDSAAVDIDAIAYRALLRFDDRSMPVPDLASSWNISSDGVTYNFTLQKGLHWSDGAPLTAGDVVATINATKTPGFPDSALAKSWQSVVVNSSDALRLSMHLLEPHASFAAMVAQLPILSTSSVQHLLSNNFVEGTDEFPPASGEFRLSSANGNIVLLEANPWLHSQPRMHHIEFEFIDKFSTVVQMLSSHQIDGFMANTPDQYQQLVHRDSVHIYNLTSYRFVDVVFNERVPGLDDPVVRRAIAGSVDRQSVLNGAVDGMGVEQDGAVPPSILWAAKPEHERAHRDSSTRALDADGWYADNSGLRQRGNVQLSYRLLLASTPTLAAVGQELVSQFASIGVHITTVAVPPDQLQTMLLSKQTFDMALVDWSIGPDPDVSAFWRSNAVPPRGVNVSGAPKDPFLDEALDALATASEPNLRTDAISRIDQRLKSDAPAVFLYAPAYTFAVSDAVTGVSIPRSGFASARFASLASWQRSGV